jgi:hypothetical protein
MGAADDRVSELLDRWLASVELHARYLALDDVAYAKAQDWPRHQRPTRWIVDLARSRCVELKRQLAERGARGDASFAEALELMAFLTSLLGSEHVERFIPLAVEGKGKPSAAPASKAAAPELKPSAAAPAPSPRQAPAPAPSAPAKPPPVPPALAAAATPPVPARSAPSRAASKSKTTARTPGRPGAQPRTARRSEAATPDRKAPPSTTVEAKPGDHDAVTATVIADAVRLLNWGRPWPQLASLIARLADRPAEPEVWTILRAHRAAIDAQATPPAE